MLLHIRAKGESATDLGYLLGKHPEKHQTKELSFGLAHVFYPEVQDDVCSACLLLDIDTTKEMRQNRHDNHGRNANVKAGLDHYVNDRAYVASSLFSTAIARVYGSALNGRCNHRPELVDKEWSLEVSVAAVRVRGNPELLHRLFEPLGYTVEYNGAQLDDAFPDWGTSPYYQLRLKGTQTIHSLLRHLYILLPILDNRKHYFFQGEEVEKLLAKASSWLPNHPEKAFITRRYFGNKRSYQKAVEEVQEGEEKQTTVLEEKVERVSLHTQRHEKVIEKLLQIGAKRILDLGCSTGRLLQRLQEEPSFTQLTGVDVASNVLQHAAQKLGLRRRQQEADPRLKLIQGALTYQDDRFSGYDAALLVEVIEHLDPERLPALERVVFQYAEPKHVLVTTPNVEYNVLYPDLPAGQFRHSDHRFEWSRTQFEDWVTMVAERHHYTYEIVGIGEEDPKHGCSSQMAIFSKIIDPKP